MREACAPPPPHHHHQPKAPFLKPPPPRLRAFGPLLLGRGHVQKRGDAPPVVITGGLGVLEIAF